MSNVPTNSFRPPAPSSGSGSGLRLVFILVFFGVIAAGILGYQQYLASTMPKRDMQFAKETAPNVKKDEEKSSMAVLQEMLVPAGPSKEVKELKKKKPDEVAFTYDEIMKMNVKELETNIKRLSVRLEAKRSDLPPSFGGASFGGGGGDAKDDKAETKTETIESLALPLEVMRQVVKSKK